MTEGAGCTDTVLIVDDSSYIVEGLIAFLKKKYRTIAAYGGAECLAILGREIPSVIILDIMMEPIDGWETLARIKEDPRTRDIPVLMFSAKKVSEEEAREHRIGIEDFILKPVSPKKILEAIEKVLVRREANRRVVERWEAAGVDGEKIDAYLSLVTSLEADLSLCQNMKIQYDLAPPGSEKHDELETLIIAIQGRILEERGRIDAAVRELDQQTETRAEKRTGEGGQGREPAVPVPSEDRDSGGDAQMKGDSDVVPVVPPPEVRIVPVPPTVRIPGDGNRLETPPATGIEGGHEEADQVPGSGSAQETGSTQTGVRRGLPRPDGQFSEGNRPPLEGGVLRPQEGIGTGVRTGPLAGLAPGTAPLDRSLPEYTGVIRQHDTEPQARPLVPADPDAFRIPRNGVPTGAGTDAPMPWTRPGDRKRTGEPPLPSSEKTGYSSPRQGLLARICSLVARLLRRE